jgi:hypothetical protein
MRTTEDQCPSCTASCQSTCNGCCQIPDNNRVCPAGCGVCQVDCVGCEIDCEAGSTCSMRSSGGSSGGLNCDSAICTAVLSDNSGDISCVNGATCVVDIANGAFANAACESGSVCGFAIGPNADNVNVTCDEATCHVVEPAGVDQRVRCNADAECTIDCVGGCDLECDGAAVGCAYQCDGVGYVDCPLGQSCGC